MNHDNNFAPTRTDMYNDPQYDKIVTAAGGSIQHTSHSDQRPENATILSQTSPPITIGNANLIEMSPKSSTFEQTLAPKPIDAHATKSKVTNDATMSDMIISQQNQNAAILTSHQAIVTQLSNANAVVITSPQLPPTLVSNDTPTTYPCRNSNSPPAVIKTQPETNNESAVSIGAYYTEISNANASFTPTTPLPTRCSTSTPPAVHMQPGTNNESIMVLNLSTSSNLHTTTQLLQPHAHTSSDVTFSTSHNDNGIDRENFPLKSEYFTQNPQDNEMGMPSWREKTKSIITRRGSRTKWGARLWISYFGFLFIAILIQIIFGVGEWAFPDGRPSCSGKVEGRKNTAMCDTSESLAEVVDQLSFLSAFILGGFVISSVQHWLTRRQRYTMFEGATRNILINLCTIIRCEQDRHLVSRWTVLGFEFAVLAARNLIDTDEGREYLEKLNLLQPGEWDTMINGDRHTTVWYWIQMKAMKLSQEEMISQHEFSIICTAVTILRDNATNLMDCNGYDQPPPYIFLCAILVNMNLFLHSISKGFEWAIWMHDTHGEVWKEPKMYVQVFGLFLFSTIYANLFDVCGLLYNPYGPRKIDLKHYMSSRQIRKLAEELSKGPLPQAMDCARSDSRRWILNGPYENEEISIANKVTQRRISSVDVMRTSLVKRGSGRKL